ncbi:MAG: homocitrate synthase/isopropylmalate synthase family protein [Candidatus Thorarchaeota archaeon]
MQTGRQEHMENLEKAGLAVNYNKIPGTKSKSLPKRVHIWDETLRDGEQTPGVALTIDEKIEIAKKLDEIGTAIVAVGFPAVSEEEKKAVAVIAKEGLSNASVAAEHGLIVDYIAEDATRSDMEFLCKAYRTAIDAGADKICIADTVGFVRPEVMRHITREVRTRLWTKSKYQVPMAAHCHDDFGLATANTLAAIEEGVTYPHVCVNAYGERAGNAAFEEVVMALEELYGVDTGIETEKLFGLSKLVERHFVVPLPLHKAISGDNAFTHSSGIHSHGQLTHSMTYEPISPTLVGRRREFHLGKFVGRHFVEYLLKMGGVKATPEQAREIADRVKRTHEEQKKTQSKVAFEKMKGDLKDLRTGVSEREFWAIVFDVV